MFFRAAISNVHMFGREDSLVRNDIAENDRQMPETSVLTFPSIAIVSLLVWNIDNYLKTC